MTLAPRGLSLVAALTALGIVAQWLPWSGAGYAWRMAALALLLVICHDAWRARGLSIRIGVPGRIVLPLGVDRVVELVVSADVPTVLELRPGLPEAVVADEGIRRVELAPGQPQVLRWDCRAVRLGDHGWAQVPVRVLGPRELTWWRRELPTDASVRVVPASALQEPSSVVRRESAARLTSVASSGSEILQLRPYRPGDPRRTIDWKATARSGRLISRDFTHEQHREVVIAIDAGRTSAVEFDGLTRLGHFANLASRMIGAAARDDDLVGLIVFASQPMVVCKPARRAAVRLQNVLAGLTPQAEESNPLAAVLRLGTMVQHRTLVVMLTDLDDAAATGQLVEAARLVLPKHVLVVVDLSSPDVAALAAAPARGWADAYASLAAQEYRASVRRNCAMLERLGCRTVLAPPSAAGGLLMHTYGDLKLSRRI